MSFSILKKASNLIILYFKSLILEFGNLFIAIKGNLHVSIIQCNLSWKLLSIGRSTHVCAIILENPKVKSNLRN